VEDFRFEPAAAPGTGTIALLTRRADRRRRGAATAQEFLSAETFRWWLGARCVGGTGIIAGSGAIRTGIAV
jgi:hypothetical protein